MQLIGFSSYTAVFPVFEMCYLKNDFFNVCENSAKYFMCKFYYIFSVSEELYIPRIYIFIGLIKISSGLNVNLLAPRKKISILLIGNHSAGKSTFINWYIEEHILKTGVAIETQGFSFVTSGKKRESLTGNATLHLYPHFKPLSEVKGLTEYIATEISTSKQKKFSLITFIDTPGLVDGDMNYPFEVEKAIMFLGDMADLIFVFFDPIGQALCKRTLNLVEALNAKHSERIKLFLSKADEAGNEADRQKVLMQIVQEICKRPTLNKAGFDLPTIFIPNPNKPARCANQIEEMCRDIEKTINRIVQHTLNTLEYDCSCIERGINEVLSNNETCKTENLRSSGKGVLFGLLGFVFFTMLFLGFFVSWTPNEILLSIFGERVTEILLIYYGPLLYIWRTISLNYQLFILACVVLVSSLLLIFARRHIRLKTTLSRKQKNLFLEKREYVASVVKNRKRELYQDYLRQSVADHEM